jgi:hypothetical protein
MPAIAVCRCPIAVRRCLLSRCLLSLVRQGVYIANFSDPSFNGHLHYPKDLDRPLNEAAADKIRAYRTDYNNRPSDAISSMPAIASSSGRLHSEFACLLFSQAHRKTDRFFAASGVQLAQSASGLFHFRRAPFSSQLKSKVGNILARQGCSTTDCLEYRRGTYSFSVTHSPITLSNLYISIRQHTSAYVSIRQHPSASVSIRQHTSAYVSHHTLKPLVY